MPKMAQTHHDRGDAAQIVGHVLTICHARLARSGKRASATQMAGGSGCALQNWGELIFRSEGRRHFCVRILRLFPRRHKAGPDIVPRTGGSTAHAAQLGFYIGQRAIEIG